MPPTNDMQAMIAAQLRQDYPNDYPPSAQDADVVKLGEIEHGQEVSGYQQSYIKWQSKQQPQTPKNHTFVGPNANDPVSTAWGKGMDAINASGQAAIGDAAEGMGKRTGGEGVLNAIGAGVLDAGSTAMKVGTGMLKSPLSMIGGMVPEIPAVSFANKESYAGELRDLLDVKESLSKFKNSPADAGTVNLLDPKRLNMSSSGEMASDLQAGKGVPDIDGSNGAIIPGSEAGKVGETPGDQFKQWLEDRISKLSEPAKDRTRVVQPGPLDKLAGNVLQTANAEPARYTSAWIADPTILDHSVTPDVSAVSKEYTQVFKKAGMSIDSDKLTQVLGKGYFPNEGQVSQHMKNITDQVDLLQNEAYSPDPSALFMARSEAAAVKRSAQYATNPSLKRYVDQSLDTLDSALEENGMPEIKDLSAKFFRAKAQESAEHILPMNKNMSPNALRGLLMMRNLAKGGAQLAMGPDRLQGAMDLGAGLAMSPKAASTILGTVLGTVPGTSGLSLAGGSQAGVGFILGSTTMGLKDQEEGK